MASWQPESWNDRLRWARGDGAGPAVADGGGVSVDATAFQGGEGELGRDGDGGAESEGDDGEQAQRGEQDGHRRRPGAGILRRVPGPWTRSWSGAQVGGGVRWARGAPPPGCPGVRVGSVGRGGRFRGTARRRVRASAARRLRCRLSRARHLGPRAGGGAPRFCGHEGDPDGAGRLGGRGGDVPRRSRGAVRRLRPGGVGAAGGERAAAADGGRAGAAAQPRGRGRPRRGAGGVPAAVAAADPARAGERAAVPGVPDVPGGRRRRGRRS